MQIGEVIRKYRKSKNMTQEEMANRLGVTAPAVNKWENGNSLPDIMLLAPIARLLDISLDTLLSFREELTQEEINNLVSEINSRLKAEPYDEVFGWAKKIVEQYPNCEWLILQMAVVLDAHRIVVKVENGEQYDDYILACFNRILTSKDEKLRGYAADALFGYYIRKEQWEKAEEYLSYFSEENPERKRKQAYIYSKTGRLEEAYRTYEQILFSGYNMSSMVMHSIYMLAMEEGNVAKAGQMVEKQQQLAKLFEMGRYNAVSTKLEWSVARKAVEETLEAMEQMLDSVDTFAEWTTSSLFEHMEFRKAPREEFLATLKKNLLENFRDEETFGFLKENERYRELVKNNQ